MTLKSLILGGALAAALSLPAQAASLLNAGFESGDLSGWTFTSGLVDVATEAQDDLFGTVFGADLYTAPEGGYFALLTAGDEGVDTLMSQAFTLSTTSTLSFDAAFLARDYDEYDDFAFVRLVNKTTNQTTTLFSSSVGVVGNQGHTLWQRFTSEPLLAGDYVLEAGVTNVLAGGPDYSSQLLIDGVSIAVPEPAQWALMLTGFGAIGGALRLRRRSASGLSAA